MNLVIHGILSLQVLLINKSCVLYRFAPPSWNGGWGKALGECCFNDQPTSLFPPLFGFIWFKPTIVVFLIKILNSAVLAASGLKFLSIFFWIWVTHWAIEGFSGNRYLLPENPIFLRPEWHHFPRTNEIQIWVLWWHTWRSHTLEWFSLQRTLGGKKATPGHLVQRKKPA